MTQDKETNPSKKQGKSNKKPSKTEMRRSARKFAVQAVYSWQMAGQPINEIEAMFHTDNDMSQTDVSLFSEILRGVSSNSTALDEAFAPFLDRGLNELDPIERAVLRIGSFELIHRIEVPYRVVINESVDLAKVFGATESHKYVNGILDKLSQRVRMVEIRARHEAKKK
ncbi:MAG: N utilization substance protein B [Oceanospirillaceae bacterium]